MDQSCFDRSLFGVALLPSLAVTDLLCEMDEQLKQRSRKVDLKLLGNLEFLPVEHCYLVENFMDFQGI